MQNSGMLKNAKHKVTNYSFQEFKFCTACYAGLSVTLVIHRRWGSECQHAHARTHTHPSVV